MRKLRNIIHEIITCMKELKEQCSIQKTVFSYLLYRLWPVRFRMEVLLKATQDLKRSLENKLKTLEDIILELEGLK